MGLKDLFINSDETVDNKPKQEPVEVSRTKFPTAQSESIQPEAKTSIWPFGSSTPTQTPTPSVSSNQVSPEHINKALEAYQNGFDSLNQAGYDFYEFYQAVAHGDDIKNPAVYAMAFRMGSSMDRSITKDKLVQQSEFYTTEITKQYNTYVSSGTSKRQELINKKNNENQALVNELELMKQQLETIKVQIQDRENKLNAIDGKYCPQINEIDSKLAANDIAKNQVINSIEQVKQGIINNLK
jgi:hypothetical protein